MQLIDGKALALQIQTELKEKVSRLKMEGKRPPHLVAVLVGDNPASQSYVRNKIRSCERVGYRSTLHHLDSEVSETQLMQLIDRLNTDQEVDGFMVQLPLPSHIDETKVTLAIRPEKDVDGFHPCNFGRMTQGLPAFKPATPLGIMEMLKRYHIDTAGKECVVLGRSNIVGRPISIMLSSKGNPGNATVSVLHSRSRDITDRCAQADIIIAAIGIPQFVKADMVKKGAVLIDVGINRIEDPTRKSGYRLVGDVDFDSVADKCSYITPVPGGVGPMTVTALLINTWKAYAGEVYNLAVYNN